MNTATQEHMDAATLQYTDTATMHPADTALRDAVTHELEWDSALEARGIDVVARDGVVTLAGFVGTYAEKLEAERAAKRVRGVRVVVNDLQARLWRERTDPEIASDVATALRLRPTIPDSIQAVVHRGHVTFTGTAPNLYVRTRAVTAVRHVSGVKSVRDLVQVVPPASCSDLRRRILQALHRSAAVDARNLTIGLKESTVMLQGAVGSWAEREAAERAVMHAPGVTEVVNSIVVAPHLGPVPVPEPVDEMC